MFTMLFRFNANVASVLVLFYAYFKTKYTGIGRLPSLHIFMCILRLNFTKILSIGISIYLPIVKYSATHTHTTTNTNTQTPFRIVLLTMMSFFTLFWSVFVCLLVWSVILEFNFFSFFVLVLPCGKRTIGQMGAWQLTIRRVFWHKPL